MTSPPLPRSLAELESLLARDLVLLQEPAKDWVPPRRHPTLGPMLDVAIVGAGMAGLAAAFRLRRLGLRRLRIYDRGRSGFEGPWATYARMETLRSPKELVGPAIGLPNLTFRAWWEARHGQASFDAIYRIPRLDWMEYLRWYGRVAGVPVESETEMVDLDGDANGVVATFRSAAGERRVAARRLILATGRDGLGGPYIPPPFRGLPAAHVAHSSDPVDFGRLAGRDVAVLGAGASAIDNAAEALEAGARTVTLLVRRAGIPRVNKGMGISSPGISLGFFDLPDAERWAINQYIADEAIPPPRNSMQRVGRHANFAVLTDCGIDGAAIENGRLALATTRGQLTFDFAVLGTGFTGDWERRPELAKLRDKVLLWRDRYAPPGEKGSAFAAEPYLGPAFEFIAREPGGLPWAGRLHCFNFAATLSHGKVTGDVPAISVGADRVADGIVGLLFREDYAEHFRRLVAYDTPELQGDEWSGESSGLRNAPRRAAE